MTNSCRIVLNEEAIVALTALSERTDDPAIRFETARIFANATRSLNKSGTTTSRSNVDTVDPEIEARIKAVARSSQKDIIGLLVGMLVQSGPYPVLANESIIALALLVTFGPANTGEHHLSIVLQQLILPDALIIEALEADNNGIDIFAGILAPSTEQPSSPELRANACTLLNALDGIKTRVKSALTSVEGVSEEARAL